ncbi:fatty acid desaturase [Podospora australis]|uniref:Fatty acid desaturase n=1 Tax=Podospora australis TaxID=1536484 RepID=A0AAN6WS96_9PEZI|nr:fatty acid desaturase [Podospora australis]
MAESAREKNKIVFDPELTVPDLIVLRNLADDIDRHKLSKSSSPSTSSSERDEVDTHRLTSLNDPTSPDFDTTILSTLDHHDLLRRLPPFAIKHLLNPYISFASRIVRHPTDIVMLTHLILYFTTSLPSALYLFLGNFTYPHAILHMCLQFWYTGTYTLMMHQHIHQNGILSRSSGIPFVRLFDKVFPYITDPLMGHTWNSYYYHHVKHHHVEGNGPDDLSSTLRYQRDNIWHFLHYVGRFLFFVWLDLPLYFFRKGRKVAATKQIFWETSNFLALFVLFRINPKATSFVFLAPLMLLRLGLMVGNWGQHCFVDAEEPDSDFRSSITLIDVPSNRYCYNDGYHTSHHLNPRRHWRHHPVHFLQQKKTYATEKALVFHNIDYLMITLKVLQKDYLHLAKCLVPMGEQIDMTLEERAELLRRCTRRFTEEEIREKFPASFGQKKPK